MLATKLFSDERNKHLRSDLCGHVKQLLEISKRSKRDVMRVAKLLDGWSEEVQGTFLDHARHVLGRVTVDAKAVLDSLKTIQGAVETDALLQRTHLSQ